MSAPFRGTVNIDIKDSTPDWEPYTQPMAPDGAPNVLYVVLDDVGFSAMEPYGGLIETPNIKRIADRGLDVHELPHHGAVLADALVPDDRPEPHDERDGLHHRGDIGLPERERAHPVRVREPRRGARRAGLEHLHRRQVAPLRRGRDEHGVVEAAVAARPWLRALLRVPRRRDEPVVSGPDRGQPPGRAAGAARRTVTTSPSTSPTRRSSSSRTRRRSRPTSRSSSTTARARRTRRTTRPKEWADKYKGKFDMGYEAYRERVLERQKELGIVPDSTELSPINPYIETTSHDGKPWSQLDVVRPWDSLSDDEKRLFCADGGGLRRLPEPRRPPARSAARLPRAERAARQHARSCSSPTTAPRARAARTARSTRTSSSTALPDTIEENLKQLDELGSPRTYNHYPTGWAWAFNTPFKMWKRYSNYRGGTADPLIVSWPKGIDGAGEVRRQYTTRSTSSRRCTSASASSCPTR